MLGKVMLPSLTHRAALCAMWRVRHLARCATHMRAGAHGIASTVICQCSTRHMYTASTLRFTTSAHARVQSRRATKQQRNVSPQATTQGTGASETARSCTGPRKRHAQLAPDDARACSRSETLDHETSREKDTQEKKTGVDAAKEGELKAMKLETCFAQMAQEYGAARRDDGQPLNARPIHEVCISDANVAHWCCTRCQHIWQCGIFVRCILKVHCPRCTADAQHSIASARPDLVPLWHREDNDPFLSPHAMRADSAVCVRWLCPMCNEGFGARVKDMVRGSAMCPSCTLAQTHSAGELTRSENVLAQEWHPLRNGDLRLDQLSPTDKQTRVWWLCAVCGHDWQASVATRLTRSLRARGRVCPSCRGRDPAMMTTTTLT